MGLALNGGYLCPTPIQLAGKPQRKPNVVFENQSVRVLASSDTTPCRNVRPGNRNFRLAHANRAIKFQVVRQDARLRLNEELITQGVEGHDLVPNG